MTAPAHFLCSLNGHVMREPVQSPYGHVFERDAIERLLSQNGSVCPFTLRPLSAVQLKQMPSLRREIASFHIRQVLAKATTAPTGAEGKDDDSLYEF